MKSLKRMAAAVLTVFIMCSIMAVPVLAANDANFHVSLVLPENQAAGIKGYFDLLVEPGQTQNLSVKVSNTDHKEMVVEVEAITASTNLNGMVNYTTPGESHASLPQSFAELVHIGEPLITIPANSTKR